MCFIQISRISSNSNTNMKSQTFPWPDLTHLYCMASGLIFAYVEHASKYPYLNHHANGSIWARSLQLGLSIHPHPTFLCMRTVKGQACLCISCADPESFVRGGPTKFPALTYFFSFRGRGEEQNTTICGPSSARQRNAI